jgi:hypothetical protein
MSYFSRGRRARHTYYFVVTLLRSWKRYCRDLCNKIHNIVTWKSLTKSLCSVWTVVNISISGCTGDTRLALLRISILPPCTFGDFRFTARHFWGLPFYIFQDSQHSKLKFECYKFHKKSIYNLGKSTIFLNTKKTIWKIL